MSFSQTVFQKRRVENTDLVIDLVIDGSVRDPSRFPKEVAMNGGYMQAGGLWRDAGDRSVCFGVAAS